MVAVAVPLPLAGRVWVAEADEPFQPVDMRRLGKDRGEHAVFPHHGEGAYRVRRRDEAH